jgi:trehalose 6-phosphate phosphatase
VNSPGALLEPVIGRPSHSGVFFDFDGTLSPIVDDPAAARPYSGVPEALAALVGRYGVVGVLSGRPVAFLQPLLPAGMVISGLYGLEVVRKGSRLDHPFAGAWREAVDDVARCSVSLGPEGMHVEPKGLSMTLHYRSHPELAEEVMAWAVSQAHRSGLVVRPARMSIELHPPIDVDKGTALESLVDDLAAVSFVGDDQGDLPAFDALDRLAGTGRHTLRGAVASEEAPPELIARADVVLEGPAGVLGFLRQLHDHGD